MVSRTLVEDITKEALAILKNREKNNQIILLPANAPRLSNGIFQNNISLYALLQCLIIYS